MIEAGRLRLRAPHGGRRGMDGDEGGEGGGIERSANEGHGPTSSGDARAPGAAHAASPSASPSVSTSAGAVHEPQPFQPSTLSRQALALYVALIVYGSWYPFSGWRSLGLSPFAYLGDPWPRYWTVFDIVTNVLGYIPFGALIVLAVWPRWRGVIAVLIAALAGTLLSGVMEAVQTWLPTRVASNLDLASNALGALLGALLAAPATGALLERGFLRRLRFRWF